jgi:DNA-binding GntR family transcriptional regulator
MCSWSSYIREDLKARITSGRELPEKLTLKTLSHSYAVSVTPVRVAVNELVEEGLVVRRPNGRLAVNRRRVGRAISAASLARPVPPRDFYAEISRDLIERSLGGEPAFVREQEAASRYGISPSAVRQVFNRLVGAGLLEHVPRRGWRLCPFRRRDFLDYLKIREVLELKALSLAWNRLEDHELQRIYGGNVLPASPGERPKVDNSLHAYLVEKANNRYLRDFFDRHGKYYEMLFRWDSLDRDSARETVQQHRQIIEALLRRDRKAAREALRHHIRTNYGPLMRIR